MKKILLIFLLIAINGCDKEDEGCTCYGKFTKFGNDGYFYIPNLPIDCNTKRPLNPPPGNEDAIFIGCENRY